MEAKNGGGRKTASQVGSGARRGRKASQQNESTASVQDALRVVVPEGIPDVLGRAVDFALQELCRAMKPATRRTPAHPEDPLSFVIGKLRQFAQTERDNVSAEELAIIRKRSGRGRGKGRGRRRSVVCADDTAATVDANWKPKVVAKAADVHASLKKMISKSLLFRGVAPQALLTLVDCMFRSEFAAGAEIIKEGDPGDNFYIVFEGSAKVLKREKVEPEENPTGFIVELGSGAIFGELALMYNAPRSASVVAGDQGTVCWAIDRTTFRSVLRQRIEESRRKFTRSLENVKILSELSSYERIRLADTLEEEIFHEGDVIIQEGDVGNHFYMIMSGQVKVTKEISGDVECCPRIGEGGYFGEIALVLGVPRQATVTATSSVVQTVRVDRDIFKRVLGPIGDILERNIDLYKQYEEQ